MGKTLRWVIPGSRLLLTDRAAILQSGSPPGVRSAQPAACLQPFWVPGPNVTFEDEDENDYTPIPDGPRSRYYRPPR